MHCQGSPKFQIKILYLIKFSVICEGKFFLQEWKKITPHAPSEENKE